jgi:hypothetical protein
MALQQPPNLHDGSSNLSSEPNNRSYIMDIDEAAETIAKLIADTDTDYRGNLLHKVGTILNNNSQYYTANLIFIIAERYGIKEE